MRIKAIVLAAATLAFTHSASAAIVDNGAYTTVNGVDWLDLTETAGMSYNDVTAQMGAGGLLEGWSYASRAQLSDLWTVFGGDSNYYNGLSIENNGLFDRVAPLLGDLNCTSVGCTAGDGWSNFMTGDILNGQVAIATMGDSALLGVPTGQDLVQSYSGKIALDFASPALGSALMRTSPVPLPASVWLFGSGLLGLFGVIRRKAHA